MDRQGAVPPTNTSSWPAVEHVQDAGDANAGLLHQLLLIHTQAFLFLFNSLIYRC